MKARLAAVAGMAVVLYLAAPGQGLVAGPTRCETWMGTHEGDAPDGRCVQREVLAADLLLGPDRTAYCFGIERPGASIASSQFLSLGSVLAFTVFEQGIGVGNAEDYFFVRVNGAEVFRANSFGHSCGGPNRLDVELPVPRNTLLNVSFGVRSGGNGMVYLATVTNIRA